MGALRKKFKCRIDNNRFAYTAGRKAKIPAAQKAMFLTKISPKKYLFAPQGLGAENQRRIKQLLENL